MDSIPNTVVTLADDLTEVHGRSFDNREIRKILKAKVRELELLPFQAELIKLQKHIERYGKKIIILFDGRDASGKGGTIRRVTRYMNEKHYRVVALGKPSADEVTELHMKRYIQHFPRAGEIVMFDRSWYNRAMVEPVFRFCTVKQYKKFLKHVVSYEANFLDDDSTILIKLYFSVSKAEQQRRFESRKTNPLKQWKLSEVDLQAQELWDEFTEKKLRMLKRTHTRLTPWTIIKSDDKHLARLATIKVILNSVRYRGRSPDLDYAVDPGIVIDGGRELAKMKRQIEKSGKPKR
jgi:polyphosphate kinase